MSQLTVYYILAVQFRTHSIGEKSIFNEAKVQTTSNSYHAVQKVASDELAELQKLM